MLKKESENDEIVTIITQINELLIEVKNEQSKMKKEMQNNHKVNMKKFAKLIEYNEILDMTNTLFEKRLTSIENLLYEVFKA